MNKYLFSVKNYFFIVFLSTFLVVSVVAQSSGASKTAVAVRAADVVTLKLGSKLMAREMPYRVVLPANYNNSNETTRYPVVYLLHGLTGHYSNWTDKTQLAEYALYHKFIIVTPEGDNGWYADSVVTATDKYESYIINELIPEIDKKYRTLPDRDHRVIAGLSMGGYGSLKFGFKYPEMFSLVGSLSGALGATDFDQGASSTQPATGFMAVVQSSVGNAFGPRGGEARKANDIFNIAKELTPEKVKVLPYIFESCGTEDMLIASNRDFLTILAEKKIPHEYREHPGGHDWVFWNDQVREFLDLADRRLKK